MIEKLTIRNFKSWEICDLEFGKVTALFGANSSGKTSILQFLLALKQTASSRDRRIFNFGGDERDFVDLGSYESAVHGHDVSKGIGFDIKWDTDKISKWYMESSDAEEAFKVLHGSFFVELANINEEVTVKTIRSKVQGKLSTRYDDTGPDIEGDYSGERSAGRNVDGTYSSYIPSNGQVEAPIVAHMISFFEWVDIRNRADAENYRHVPLESSALNESFEKLLGMTHYLGPLRAYPQREYRWTGERPSTVGVRGEFAVQTMLADLVAGKPNSNQEQGKLLASANTWLKRLGVVEEIELRPVGEKSRLYEVIVKSPNFKHEANLADVGFGVSQVLPIVVMAHLVPEGSLIILEQPELHLHPNVQTQLADFFLELSVERNIQFLIESHSERLMQRLQQLMVEKPGKLATLKDNDLRFYFCRRDPDGSVLEPVHSDLTGSITNIPGDFYDSVLPFLQQLEADGLGTEPIDISANHDEYVAQPSVRVLRDKDDQSE